MEIKKRFPLSMSEVELDLCRANNLGGDGEMLEVLEGVLRDNRDAIAYLLYNDDEFVGWAIIFDEWLPPNEGRPILHVFVSENHRRRGYGSMLVNAAYEDNSMSSLFTLPHDTTSYRFYSRHLNKITFNINDAVYVLAKPEFDNLAKMMV